MKRTVKRILSALLIAVMLIGIAPIGGIDFAPKASAKDISSYSVGDTITYGSYPQSEVTDSDLITAIEAAGANISWVDYNYYAGTGEWADGEMKPVKDMMLYKDITYGGNKYRAVKINQYRPYWTCETSSTSHTYQDDNGYYTGNVYYFKYEPLTWRVLDPSEGYVMCNQIIDSQAYQNFIYYNGSSWYNSKDCTNYASDWVTSSLRQWLNDDFYNTAFTSEEKAQIGTSHLENKSTYSSTYDSADTYDKIFPISYNDAINSAYGFDTYDSDDTARQLKGTDYAKCQGLWVYNDEDSSYNGNSWWWLRSPYDSYGAAEVDDDGWAYNGCGVGYTYGGIVPAFKFNPKSIIIHSHTLNHITVPSSCTVNGMEYDICTECGETFNEKVIPMGHKLNHVVVPSTCKVAGMEYDICSECGETFNEKTLVKLAHTWGDWTVVKEATTTVEGQEKRTCSACGEVETRAIEKLKALVDEKTGVEINYNDEYEANTEIKVEEQFSGKSFQLLNTEYGKVNSKIYDIATYKDGVKVQPDGEITVRIPLPDSFTTNKVFVCYVDSVSGKVTKIPCEVKDGYVTFKTNHFSEYAIVEQLANVKSVSVSDITMNYKKSAKINPTITADDGAEYTVKYSSSNTSVARVDDNGNIYGAKRGSATITCTVTDSNGNTVSDSCNVTVKYSFGQWLIIILLFGWIWY